MPHCIESFDFIKGFLFNLSIVNVIGRFMITTRESTLTSRKR